MDTIMEQKRVIYRPNSVTRRGIRQQTCNCNKEISKFVQECNWQKKKARLYVTVKRASNWNRNHCLAERLINTGMTAGTIKICNVIICSDGLKQNVTTCHKIRPPIPFWFKCALLWAVLTCWGHSYRCHWPNLRQLCVIIVKRLLNL